MNKLIEIAIIIIVILISMVLHELAHGLVAYYLGDNTAKDEGRLTLNPVKHLDPVNSFVIPVVFYLMGLPVFGGAKPVPINPYKLKFKEWGMALVAVAGPLTNFMIALIMFLIGYYSGGLVGELGLVWQNVFVSFVSINLGFMVFNLLPIPPLDGSRVLYAIAPDRVRDGIEMIERSAGLILIFILVGFFGTFLGRFMSLAIYGIFDFFVFMVGGA